jgi:hypothetical protein
MEKNFAEADLIRFGKLSADVFVLFIVMSLCKEKKRKE